MAVCVEDRKSNSILQTEKLRSNAVILFCIPAFVTAFCIICTIICSAFIPQLAAFQGPIIFSLYLVIRVSDCCVPVLVIRSPKDRIRCRITAVLDGTILSSRLPRDEHREAFGLSRNGCMSNLSMKKCSA